MTPFKALSHLADTDKPKTWDVSQLRPDLSELELSEELATYFNKVTDTFTPLTDDPTPVTYSSPIPLLGPEMVAEMLRKAKKPSSTVDGDILPCLVNGLSDSIAVPLTRIFNICHMTYRWPSPWKVETQTPIPKTNNPTKFEELRNISCTNLMPKVMESILLERLQTEIPLKYAQFGGVKGTGTTHFIIETYQKIIDCLEQGQTAVSIISIDFSKAFNRLCHHTCIAELAKRGGSTETISMVAAFLRGRKMNMKVHGTKSTTHDIRGGAPQGTKVGNFLFSVVIETIEDQSSTLMEQVPPVVHEMPDQKEKRERPPRLARELVPTFQEFTRNHEGLTSTPLKGATTDGVLRYCDTSGRGLEESDYENDLILHEVPPPNWKTTPPWTIKYVDDLNGGQTHYLPAAASTISTKKEHKIIHAEECQEIFDTVKKNATKIKMVVNDSKTNLLCISSNNNLRVTSYIETDEQRIDSSEQVKILGFMFNNNTSMSANNSFIRRKFGLRVWTLTHLKRAKIDTPTLVKIYAASIRPVIMYAAQAYHFMLTEEQSDELEGLQRLALKIIYPPGTSYRRALEDSGLPRLDDFRNKLCRKFALKTSANPRYAGWFPKNQPPSHDLRNREPYHEETARTERRRKSPIFQMRKILNEK